MWWCGVLDRKCWSSFDMLKCGDIVRWSVVSMSGVGFWMIL